MNLTADLTAATLTSETDWQGPDGLAALEARLWQELTLAAATKGHGWRIGRLTDPSGHDWEIGRQLPH